MAAMTSRENQEFTSQPAITNDKIIIIIIVIVVVVTIIIIIIIIIIIARRTYLYTNKSE
jgi:heme/copper-type cytochrome/quinol oxidase subunit 2